MTEIDGFEGFDGFAAPESNFFRLPNQWTDITRDIQSLAELKVVEYVLRHTWGYHEYGQVKRISLDEFENGRKKKGGERLDRGIGMRKQAILSGIRLAVDHGLLIVIEDESNDGGRRRKFYGLRMKSKEGVCSSYAGGMKIIPAMYDDHTPYIEINLGKKPYSSLQKSKGRRLATSPPPQNGKPLLYDEFDNKAAGQYRQLLVQHDSILVNGFRKPRIDTLSKLMFRLRVDLGIPKVEITEVLDWLINHYGEPYVPKIFKLEDLLTKWEKFKAAMERQEFDEANGRQDNKPASHARVKLCKELKTELDKMFPDEVLYSQGDLDRLLVKRGLRRQSVMVTELY